MWNSSLLKQRSYWLVFCSLVPVVGIVSIAQTSLQSQPPKPVSALPSPSLKVSTTVSDSPQATSQPKRISQKSYQVSRAVTPTPAKKRAATHARQHKAAHTTIEMRVAIANGADSLPVGTSTPGEILDAQGNRVGKLPSLQGALVEPNQQGLRLGTLQTPAVVWLVPTQGGYVYVGKRWYRGRLLLVAQGDRLMAINYVKLDDYLYSVVGSEMPANWPLEALKAQAIAARSYALVHYIRPASAWYNLGDDERWQAYNGLDGEYNTTHQAVDATAKEVLSYQGGIVESLYASSDDIVAKAHGGVGMSQNGANQLAMQGYNYRQILGAYYPGTSLAQLKQ